MTWTSWVLKHMIFFPKITQNWRIFHSKGLEDFSSNSSSISCPTGAIAVYKTRMKWLNIITTKLLLHNIVCYENGNFCVNKFTIIYRQKSRNISSEGSVETDDTVVVTICGIWEFKEAKHLYDMRLIVILRDKSVCTPFLSFIIYNCRHWAIRERSVGVCLLNRLPFTSFRLIQEIENAKSGIIYDIGGTLKKV